MEKKQQIEIRAQKVATLYINEKEYHLFTDCEGDLIQEILEGIMKKAQLYDEMDAMIQKKDASIN